MRIMTTALLLGGLLATGCNSFSFRKDAAATAAVDTQPPTAEGLLAYLNECSSRLNSVQSKTTWLDCKQNHRSISLESSMVCEKPRNFRLMGDLAGSPAVDIGSNSNEFWYWIRHDNPPYLYHCSYEAMSRGTRLPFPFQPDMVTAALGMGEYDADVKKYDYKVTPQTLELSEQTTSAQGQPVKKVTVVARAKQDVSAGKPQITDYILRDAQDKEICRATVLKVQVLPVDQSRNAIVPQKVKLSWPGQQLEMTMTLDRLTVNNIDPNRAPILFSRENLTYQSFDLARGTPDAKSTSIQRVRGNMH